MLKVYIFIDTQIGAVTEVVNSLQVFQELRYMYRVTGPYDVIVMAEVLDQSALGDLLDRIRTLPNIMKTVTSIVVPR